MPSMSEPIRLSNSDTFTRLESPITCWTIFPICCRQLFLSDSHLGKPRAIDETHGYEPTRDAAMAALASECGECIGMNEDQQKRDYLDEHLPYMLKMLRYTYGQMLQKQHYLSWNAHFESFAVHARNLVKFLTNSDARNFKAHKFVQDYKARVGDIQGAMAKLEQQVFHLGKNRPPTFVGKFNTEHAQEV